MMLDNSNVKLVIIKLVASVLIAQLIIVSSS